MKDEYKQAVSQQHAPQELIEKTLSRIKAEESVHTLKRKRQKVRYVLVPTFAVCAMITIIILTMRQTPRFYYTVGSEYQLKSNIMEDKMEEITIKDYEDYLLVPVSTMIPDGTLMQVRVFAKFDDTHDKIVKDRAVLYYEWKGLKLIVQVSKTEDIAPEVLESTKETKIHTTSYRLFSSEDETKFMASCEVKGIHYLYICNHWTKKDFETFLLAN